MTDLILSTSSIRFRLARFRQRAIRNGDCLEVPGNPKTYPSIGLGAATSGTARMSRVAWTLDHNQAIPDGLWVLHTCDNRRCIESNHLYVGTRKQNVADMVNRDRTGRRRHPDSWTPKSYPMHYAKLTWEDVDAIRATKGVSYRTLAARYNVSRDSIGRVIRGETWHPEARP